MSRRTILAVAVLALLALGLARWASVRMGRQPDGSFMVSSGQRIEGGALAFDGRPIDLALHPSGKFYAVLNKRAVFLGMGESVRDARLVSIGAGAGFRGL
ncbi:MAG TPA: hypothetical protein VGH33_18400, partial [Isosphaeraceae bacterium]